MYYVVLLNDTCRPARRPSEACGRHRLHPSRPGPDPDPDVTLNPDPDNADPCFSASKDQCPRLSSLGRARGIGWPWSPSFSCAASHCIALHRFPQRNATALLGSECNPQPTTRELSFAFVCSCSAPLLSICAFHAVPPARHSLHCWCSTSNLPTQCRRCPLSSSRLPCHEPPSPSQRPARFCFLHTAFDCQTASSTICPDPRATAGESKEQEKRATATTFPRQLEP